MFAASLGWFLLTRLNVWMVFLVEWRIRWWIWWDSAFAGRRVWRVYVGFPSECLCTQGALLGPLYATWSKTHACTYQKMPQTMQTSWFSLFPMTKWWNMVGKKHGSIDCLLYHSPVTAVGSRFWGAARSTEKRVVANYYFGEETQWPHSWPEQGRKGTQIWEMDRYNEQTSESMQRWVCKYVVPHSTIT